MRLVIRLLERLPRPLDPVRSIKAKLSIVIMSAVAMTLAATWVGLWLNLKPVYAVVAALGCALAVIQILAHGMVAPLREMSVATMAMARGEYRQRVRETSRDEVGELARSFNTMAADLAAVDQVRRDLVANVGHELRTPLAALQGTLENIADGVSTADARTIAVMLRQTDRLNRMVSDLLDLSRMEAGVAPMTSAPVDLRAVIDDVVAETALHRPDAVITADVAGPCPLTGDGDRLHQLVANLVENGLAHGRTRQVTIAVRTAGDQVAMTVDDDGPGIAPHVLPHVFDRFRRGNDLGGGSGLGLAISRWIAELHGGSIDAANRDPSGTRITVRLPTGPRPAS